MRLNNVFYSLHGFKMLRNAGSRLMEPYMKLEITVEEQHLHAVLGDLAQHRSSVLEVTQRQGLKVYSRDS